MASTRAILEAEPGGLQLHWEQGESHDVSQRGLVLDIVARIQLQFEIQDCPKHGGAPASQIELAIATNGLQQNRPSPVLGAHDVARMLPGALTRISHGSALFSLRMP